MGQHSSCRSCAVHSLLLAFSAPSPRSSSPLRSSSLTTVTLMLRRTRMQLTRVNTTAGSSVQGYFATLRSALQQGPGTLFIGALGRWGGSCHKSLMQQGRWTAQTVQPMCTGADGLGVAKVVLGPGSTAHWCAGSDLLGVAQVVLKLGNAVHQCTGDGCGQRTCLHPEASYLPHLWVGNCLPSIAHLAHH